MTGIQGNSTTSFLQRLLKDPQLPEKVSTMSSGELMRIIQDVGLEDSGEVIALASTKQIELLFDVDLWRAKEPGADDVFDPERFGTWLEVLLELGGKKAAEKISEMDEDFLVLAFSSLAWVAELDWVQEGCELDSRLDKAMESSLSHEIENFVLFSRNHRVWDALITLVSELETYHYSFLSRLLSRCSALLVDQADDEGGLYKVLTAENQLIDDVAFEREKRREAQGYVVPANARAFLKLCEGPKSVPNKVTPPHLLVPLSPSLESKSEQLPAIKHNRNRFKKVFEVLEANAEHFERLSEQIAYLSNVLMSGWDWGSRIPRPEKATEIVLEVCELGLESSAFVSFPDAFRKGWEKWKK